MLGLWVCVGNECRDQSARLSGDLSRATELSDFENDLADRIKPSAELLLQSSDPKAIELAGSVLSQSSMRKKIDGVDPSTC
jgi:hypothetical protein